MWGVLPPTPHMAGLLTDLPPEIAGLHASGTNSSVAAKAVASPGSVASVASSTTLWARAQRERSQQQGLKIVSDSIAAAQARGETFADFKAVYRPVGVDGVLKDLWTQVDTQRVDDCA